VVALLIHYTDISGSLKCNDVPDTAMRDIAYLAERGLLVRNPGGGRSTSYSLRC